MSSVSTASLIRSRTLYRQQPKARRPTLALPVLFFVCLVTCAGVFAVWTSSQVRKEQYRLGELKSETAQLEIENHAVRGEVARLENPARLEKIAQERIGLVYPEPGQVLSLSAAPAAEGKQLSLAQPPRSSSGN